MLQALQRRGWKLATAESCTGGLLGASLTAVPGSSASYCGGVISYCNDLKHRLLGVPLPMLAQYGAVSSQVAEAMAQGARRLTGAQVGIGITGLAGPDSDGSGLPIGLVFVGYADEAQCLHLRLQYDADRQTVRENAVQAALCLLLQKLS